MNSMLVLVTPAYSRTINICSRDVSENTFIKLVEDKNVLQIKKCSLSQTDDHCLTILGAGRNVRVESIPQAQLRETISTAISLGIESSVFGGANAAAGKLAFVLAAADGGPTTARINGYRK